MGCPGCGRGFHDECENGSCEDCHVDISQLVKSFKVGTGRGAPTKDPENVTDRHSTGRKRAAQLYPIFKDKPCEWQGKKNCGGGTPIVGCIKNLQRDRHHGPIKDTLRNEPGNVHRICKSCHNRWHAVNDPIYNEEQYASLPHRPEDADELELLANESYWRLKK
jgi:hypothetical protein